MTKKHFIKIAEDINTRAIVVYSSDSSYDEKWFGLLTLAHLVNDFVSTFSKFNDNFNATNFINACGVNKLKLELETIQATQIASGI